MAFYVLLWRFSPNAGKFLDAVNFPEDRILNVRRSAYWPRNHAVWRLYRNLPNFNRYLREEVINE